jgi:3-isopropylmalate/(R)-2-methylmalate dehydratase large subunit
MGTTLLAKVWDRHAVRRLPTGQTQLFIGWHLVHEVTSPQAFDMLRLGGRGVAFPDRTWATVDHIVPTDGQPRPFLDQMAEQMTAVLERNCREFGIRLFDLSSTDQGIVHVIGPELGLTQPGMTIACGDSHTSTHGAFGSIAFGIGTSQVRDVLVSQSLAIEPLKVRRVDVTGTPGRGVYAKDVALAIIRRLGVNGGVGFAYEYGGAAVDAMSMDARMTLCNMSIEGGARVGYVNPDATTFEYIRGRAFAPAGSAFDRACAWWRSMASDADAVYDDRVELDGSSMAPMVTWGTHPGQSMAVEEAVPSPEDEGPDGRGAVEEALAYMGLEARRPIAGTRIDVAFIGSCTNPGPGRARIAACRQGRRSRRLARDFPRCGIRVAPGGLFDVPGDES